MEAGRAACQSAPGAGEAPAAIHQRSDAGEQGAPFPSAAVPAMVRPMKQPRLLLGALALIALLTAAVAPLPGGAADTTSSVGAAELPPLDANAWTIECGPDPRDAQRFCRLTYLHIDEAFPGDYVVFGVYRKLGVEAAFLQTQSGLSAGSRVWVRVDDLSAREFAAPKPRKLLQAPQAADPLAGELATGSYVVIAFQPANGQRRTVRIPLDGFDLLFEQLRQEAP